MKKYIYISLVIIISVYDCEAQHDTLNSTNKRIYINGYIKDLRGIAIFSKSENILLDNLIHHRLNTETIINDDINLNIEFRNRIFYGEVVKNTPRYSKIIDVNNDYFDLSLIPVDKSSFLIHLMIDRGYITFNKKKWEVRAGRQRINWGINTVWNPHDIFNAYSFFDFDYEERPGSDAIRISYYADITSSYEIAAKIADDFDSTVAALLIKKNRWNYDFQWLLGIKEGDAVIGAGWAGNIYHLGFKGETSYFQNYKNIECKGSFNSAFSLDYSFKNSLYFIVSALYNSSANISASGFQNFLNYKLSAKNLSPYKYTFFTQAAFPVTPIFNTSVAFMYAPAHDVLFMNPALSLSIAPNWDFDLIVQILKGDTQNQVEENPILVHVRFKWSY